MGFVDSTWASGTAPLGYGADGHLTVVSFGPSSTAEFTTTWFRREFTVPNPGLFDRLLLRLRRDDGAVAYLNGTEVLRSNLPGNNDLAVEIHQRSLTSPDPSIDGALFADDKETITRGLYLYLQLDTSSSVIVPWRTHVNTMGRLWWGTSPGSLTNKHSVNPYAHD